MVDKRPGYTAEYLLLEWVGVRFMGSLKVGYVRVRKQCHLLVGSVDGTV